MRVRATALVCTALVATALSLAEVAQAADGTLTRATSSRAGEAQNWGPTHDPDQSRVTWWADLPADGRFAIFKSAATNLTPLDRNLDYDIFVKYLGLGGVGIVSRTTTGVQSVRTLTASPVVSDDGRVVVFGSFATEFIPDGNGSSDIYVKDLATGAFSIASTDSTGRPQNGRSWNAAVSARGGVVAFASTATNLVADDGNGVEDVFVKDRATGETTRASVATGGGEADGRSSAPEISASGRYVLFRSAASNLDGADSNGTEDIFVHDRTLLRTTRLSTSSAGAQANGSSTNPVMSVNETFVAFASSASNLVPGDSNGRSDVFVKNRLTGALVRASTSAGGGQANGSSDRPQLSADGRFVVFHSAASNLVPGDSNGRVDVFRKDLVTGDIVKVSTAADGAGGDGDSYNPRMSTDGRVISFMTFATTLLPGDGNGVVDVLIWRQSR